jgi:hypothetical protein
MQKVVSDICSQTIFTLPTSRKTKESSRQKLSREKSSLKAHEWAEKARQLFDADKETNN